MSDSVNHPSHYSNGIEVIDFVESKGWGEGFNRGNAIKYICRAGLKDKNKEVEDLEKAIFYIKREIDRIKESNDEPTYQNVSLFDGATIMNNHTSTGAPYIEQHYHNYTSGEANEKTV